MDRLLKLGLVITLLFCGQTFASVGVTSFSVNEGGGTATATVSLSSSDAPGWLLDYSTSDGTATDENTDDDYKSASGTLTFSAGDTQQDVVINIVEDTEIEGDEDFSLVVFNLRRPGSPTTSSQKPAKNPLNSKTEALPPLADGTIEIEDNDIEIIVNIQFIGGSETQSEVTLTCNSGDVDMTGTSTNTKVATQGLDETASFEVINFGPAALLCSAVQSSPPPAGYSNTTGNSCDIGFNQTQPDCLIENTLNSASIEVTRSFYDGSNQAVDVELQCTSGDINGSGNSVASISVSDGNPGMFTIEGFSTIGDNSATASDCFLTELNPDPADTLIYTATGDSQSIDNDINNPGCHFISLANADSNRCAISNSRTPISVPAVSLFSLSVLTLLILLLSAFSFRTLRPGD